MNHQALRDRRRRVLSLMLDNFSQTEIAQQLNVSQATVSRDMQALDKDTERVSMFVRKVIVDGSIVWNSYLQIDYLLREAFANYVKMENTDYSGKFHAVHTMTRLLGQKLYLLAYSGFDLPDEHRNSSEQQFIMLKKQLNQISENMPNSETTTHHQQAES